MKISRLLLALLLGAILPLAGCDREVEASRTPSGTVDFALPAALRSKVRGVADSLRVELRQGSQVRAASGALDSTIHVGGLEAGAWTIQVGLYSLGGVLRYYGESSVRVLPGKSARADVTLRPAKGSVDIVIHLEGLQDGDTTHPGAFLGTWNISNWLVPGPLPVQLSFTFDTSGGLVGWNGTDSFAGSWDVVNGDVYFHKAYAAKESTSWGLAEAIPASNPFTWKVTPEGILTCYSKFDTFAFKLKRAAPSVIPGNPTELLGDWQLLQVDTTNAPKPRGRIVFGDSGEVIGHDGCNSIRGSWSANGSELRVTLSGLSTMVYCNWDVEPNPMGMLVASHRFALEGRFLYFYRDDGFRDGPFVKVK